MSELKGVKIATSHHRAFTIAIDFDGTIVEEAFPLVGLVREGAKEVINKLYDEGCSILINTCRSGFYEGEAERTLRDNGIKFHYINSNLPESIKYFKQDCRKLSADLYIDDKCLTGLPTWEEIYQIVQLKKEKYEFNK